ncbi:MAG: hypothetical protein AAF604_06645 [Acidobacteriota bacterium]
MSGELERWRRAFQDRSAGADDQQVPADEIWQAVRGELPRDATQEMIDRTIEDPDLAWEWRLARELEAERQAEEGRSVEGAAGRDRVVPLRRSSWPRAPLIAAALALAMLSAIFFLRPADEEPIFRDPGGPVVESMLESDEALTAAAATLRWTGPEEARYTVSVLRADDLSELFRSADLAATEVTLPPELLADLPAGSVLLWRVEATLPDGSRVASPTFRQALRRAE